MKLNSKQQELVAEFIRDLRKKFPEIRHLTTTASADDADAVWLHVTKPRAEDRLWSLHQHAALLSLNILTEFGYHMTIFPTRARGPMNRPLRTDVGAVPA